MTIATDIQQLYVAFFNRPADAEGLNYWTVQANKNGGSVAAVANAFSASAEYQAVFGGLNHADTINLIYMNLFGRPAETAGLTFWSNAIDNGLPLSTIAQSIAAGAQNADATAIHNKVVYAVDFTNAASDTSAEIIGYSGAAANAVAKSQLLTITDNASLAAAVANIDANVAAAVAAHTVVGTITALTTGLDSITLTGNNNVVNALAHNVATPSANTLSTGDTISGSGTGNVLNIYDQTTGGTWTALTTPGVTISGIQTLNLISGEPTAVNTVTTTEGFAGLTALNVTDVGGSAVTAANTTAITVIDASAAGATEAVQGGSAITVTANGVTSGGTISVGTTTAPSGAVVVTANESAAQTGGVTADAINVTGGTTVSITANLAGAAGVGNTTTGGAVTVNGTSATTSVTVKQTAAATAAAAVAGVVDGNVTISDANSASATKAGTITNVSLSNYATAAINDSALTTLTLAGKGGALTLTDSLTAPTVTTLALNANGLTATSFVDANNEITTLNVVTGGATGSTITTLTDTGLTTLNVSGTQQFTLGTTPASLTSVAVSGAAGVNLALGVNTSFVSTSTGTDVVSITAPTTLTLTGNGTANEELVWNGATAPTSTAYLGTETGFKVLGIGSGVGANQTFDLSNLTGFTALDVQANTQVGTIQLLNVAAGSHLSIDGAFAGNLVYGTADATGPTDSVSIALGSATAGAFTVGGLTLEDGTLNGLGNVTINTTTSTGLATTNTITVFQDASLTTLNVTGNAGLSIGNAIVSGAASLTINGTSTGTAGITLGGITDINLHSLTLTGTNNMSLGTINEGTTGITVSGGSDNANVSLALSGVTSTGHADAVTLGNGNNVVTDTAAAAGATVNITVGNGNNTVTVGATATNTVTFGTGTNNLIEAAGGHVGVTFAAHGVTVHDNVTAGAATSATIAASAVITGYNDTGADTITFSGDAGATGAIVTVTSAQLNTYGNNPTTLTGAVAGVLAAGGGNLTQHAIAEFVFQGNTFLVEQAGATGSAFAAGDTIVELVGVHTLTVATTATAGVLHLVG